MRRSLQRAGILSAGILLLGIAPLFGWGETGDRLVTNRAVDTLPQEMQPFFYANRQFLVEHVGPEEYVAKNGTARHTDFIQLDHYGPFPFYALPRDYNAAITKIKRPVLEQYGILPWEIGFYSKKLTDAFREHDWYQVRMSAAILAHYVNAAHDPFNTTINMDGKLSAQPGVNERFSSGLVDRYQLFFFVQPNEAVFIHDPTDHAFELCLTAHSWLENVLLADRRAHEGLSSYSQDYYDKFYSLAGAILVRQLSDASTDVGSYWLTAWINAGRPQLPQQ
jgi:hypothetical protein